MTTGSFLGAGAGGGAGAFMGTLTGAFMGTFVGALGAVTAEGAGGVRAAAAVVPAVGAPVGAGGSRSCRSAAAAAGSAETAGSRSRRGVVGGVSRGREARYVAHQTALPPWKICHRYFMRSPHSAFASVEAYVAQRTKNSFTTAFEASAIKCGDFRAWLCPLGVSMCPRARISRTSMAHATSGVSTTPRTGR